MEVTATNFIEALPEVRKAIDECDFIAIDGEFTGLRNGLGVTAYDTPEVYYAKLREGSLDFLLIQVGLCAFRFDQEQKKYLHKAFNFYVFPRTVGRNGNDVNFLCQSSSIHFLCSNGFDFNKLFKEGIPYLSIMDEEVLNEELVTKYENLNQAESTFPKVSIPDELSSTVEDACSRIEQFLSPDNKEKEIIFDKCSGFVRKLIFQTAYERFSTKNFNLCTKWVDHNALLVAQKGKSKTEMEKENFEKDKKEISQATGFAKIIKYIFSSEKLIVGHNMLLDICHIVNRFCWSLPESYCEFKAMVHTLFPRIIDTKYMCSVYPLRDLIPSSVMEHMVKRLHESPFEFKDVEAENTDFGYSMEQNKSHEAGFDAYMTGLAFISLTSYLAKEPNPKSPLSSIETLKQFENRLFIMKIVDYSFINLVGDEPKPFRRHIFHVSFPKDWKTNDIMQLFSPYGNIHISYCNQTTAWVTLFDKEKTKAVIADLIEANQKELPVFRNPCTVITWRQYYEENISAMFKSTYAKFVDVFRPTKMTLNAAASSPRAHSSSSVSQSGGDAEPVSSDVKLPTKRCSVTESVSKKRKKNDQGTSTKSWHVCELKNMVDASSDSPKACSSDISSDQLSGSDDNTQKPERTFEEPPWE